MIPIVFELSSIKRCNHSHYIFGNIGYTHIFLLSSLRVLGYGIDTVKGVFVSQYNNFLKIIYF